jgi:hypothetical protein
MLLKSLLILIVAVAAGKGKGGKGGRRGGGKGKKGGDKKSDMCRELRTTDPTRVQNDMTELLKAFKVSTTEAPKTMYCGIRSRGYPFVDVPKTEETTQTPQRRFLRKKSPVSFKVENGAVASGLVKGCDDDTYCFDNVQVAFTAAEDFTLALRRNLQDGTVVTTDEPTTTATPTSATVTVTSTNPDETITMTYTCDVAYESATDDAGAETCTPKGLKCRTKYRLAADDEMKERRAKMMCTSTMSTDDADLQAAVDSCPVVPTQA